MTITNLKRKQEPKIQGLQYLGHNMYDVIKLYAYKGMSVIVDPDDMSIGFNDRRDDDGCIELFVGDWIVVEGTRKYVVSADAFQDNYVAQPPKDHKLVDTTTGKTIDWNKW